MTYDEKPLTPEEEETIAYVVAVVNAALGREVRSMVRASVALRVLAPE